MMSKPVPAAARRRQVTRYRGCLRELPLPALAPAGWLRAWLARQRDGLTGRLDACGYPFNTGGWTKDRIVCDHVDTWGPYEQTGYWVDGMLRCARLLGDAALLARARRPIARVLRRQRADGYLGPAMLENGFRWPHAVFFRALMAEQDATGDPCLVDALRRHYLSGTSRHTTGREVCNVEPMLWAFGRTGDRRLLRLALAVYRAHSKAYPRADTAEAVLLSPKRASEHGVTYNEIAKLGAIVYLHTGNARALKASVNAFRKMDRDQMLIDGVPSSSEFLRGKDPLDTHETCDIADYTWSAGYLLMATGRVEYADKIERACFNALPGAVTADFKALQYFSCPNQVIVDRQSNHGLYQRGRDWHSYQPNHEVQCCPGEVNRVLPNYAARQWMLDGAGGLVAALYGPGRVTACVGARGPRVTVAEETAYPFDETVAFTVQTDAPVRFALTVRIPGWCRGATVALNGRPLRAPRRGVWVRLARLFRPGDRIVLHLPMDVRTSRWPAGGIGVERGPLVYAFPVPTRARAWHQTGRTAPGMPGWDFRPAGPFNYALALDAAAPAREVCVRRRACGINPWTPRTAPVVLEVPVRRVAGWGLDRRREIEQETYIDGKMVKRIVSGDFRRTPPLPDPATLPPRLGRRTETIALVPYGCTRLRIAVFPDGSVAGVE